METLIDFIAKVEEKVLYYVTHYTRNQDTMSVNTQLWVHQLNGKVVFDDYPKRDGYKLIHVYKLCDLDKNCKHIPDKKAIKKWVEGEVLLHSR